MSQIRREVLHAFKAVHLARKCVFRGDDFALNESRKQINDGFRKNQHVTNEEEIRGLIQLAHDVANELRTNVIQAVQKEEGLYELRLTEETTRHDNNLVGAEAADVRSGGCGGCECGFGEAQAMTMKALEELEPKSKR